MAVDTSHAIGENISMNAIALSLHLGVDPLGCHMYMSEGRLYQNKTNKRVSLHTT